MLLADCGCLVRSASNGPLALAELAREQADVILLDRSMPDTRASSLLTALREAAPAAKIAYFTGQEVPPADQARVDAVIHKPVRIAELEAAITQLVQIHSSSER